MIVKKFLSGIFLLLPLIIKAQTSPQLSSAEIKLGFQKLNTVGSVLYIAAHPDDENTRLLSYLAKEKKMRTGYLSLTRGDGGQNLIGNEQAELLGLLRTQELLAARRTDGAEQFFTRANDFGYSKTAAETFKIWGKEQILADAVWVIRKFSPDVIITRFPEDARAGHGHHAASAIIAHEAFLAAADPKRFPEQLKFVEPWQAKRVLWNTSNFGGNNTTSNDQLKLDVGAYNPLLGKSYGEIAAESRSKHKSQGFGSAKQRGRSLEYFTPVAGDVPKTDLFEGIDLTWKRVSGGEIIGKMIAQADQDFDMEDPAKSVAALVNILTEIEKLKDTYWKSQKEKEVKQLIVASAGLWFESYAAELVYAVGDSVKIRTQMVLRSGADVKLASPASRENTVLTNNNLITREHTFIANQITQPYWLENEHPIGTYVIKDQQLVGLPENPAAINMEISFSVSGKQISFSSPVVYKYTDPVKGEVYQPLVIALPVTATLTQKSFVFSDNKPQTIQVLLKSFTPGAAGDLMPQVPSGWQVNPRNISFNLPDKGDEQIVQFTVTPSANATDGLLKVSVNSKGRTFNRGIQSINYDHIPLQTLFPASEANLVNLNLKTDGKRIGYLPGSGDMVAASLKQIGYEMILLSENQVVNGDLSFFDAIITGVRAYNVNERMGIMQPVLLEYVKNGGTLLVQYNTSGGLDTDKIGPYPFNLSRGRVTEEDAKVTFLAPNSPALNYPNKISQKDFDGWIQERGLYFASDIDAHYTQILRMNDINEAPIDGSLLVADYGKGKFVYTSLSFFRQLPAGVPGAYRLFVNLIAKKQGANEQTNN